MDQRLGLVPILIGLLGSERLVAKQEIPALEKEHVAGVGSAAENRRRSRRATELVLATPTWRHITQLIGGEEQRDVAAADPLTATRQDHRGERREERSYARLAVRTGNFRETEPAGPQGGPRSLLIFKGNCWATGLESVGTRIAHRLNCLGGCLWTGVVLWT